MARTQEKAAKAETVERGSIYFVYRPKVEHEEVGGPDEVGRLHVVLSPEGRDLFRVLTIGRKHLPDPGRHERDWGFVDMIAHSSRETEAAFDAQHYDTRTRGERTRPAVRPAGEGVYALARKGRDLHLIYALELPERPGPVQKAFNIAREGSFVLSIKNPEKGSPANAGLPDDQQADLPKSVQRSFRGRRFEGEDPRPLDHEGAEFLLVGADRSVRGDTGIALAPEHEDPERSDIIRELRLKPPVHPAEPLARGRWA